MMKFSINEWKNFLGRFVNEKSWTEDKKKEIERDLICDLNWIREQKGYVCTIESTHYPFLLSQIPDPPIVLFIRGKASILSENNISIVGTRKPDRLGNAAARSMGKYYSTEGYNIVSGLAYGIDIAAHKGVLDALRINKSSVRSSILREKSAGRAIIVLGTSIDHIYPKAHLGIAAEVLKHGGAIVSEIAPRATTKRHNFIGRNRIISGLSMDTVIVQAPKKSGAMATADFAIEQGRELWVHQSGLIPGFEGTLGLYGSGAKVLGNNLDDLYRK